MKDAGGLPIWLQLLLTLVIAAIPATVSWWVSKADREQAMRSAEEAAREASAARASAEEMERLRRLEGRVREAKVAAYTPLIQTIGKMSYVA